jgi:F420-dependent oxidoreductase-like protein
MLLGCHVSNFTWAGGGNRLGGDFRRIVQTAEATGFDRLSVMDHVWQIFINGAPEEPMLEAYTALGYAAACTERVKLMTLVTGVTYRDPGLLAKQVTTLDVLSGGRAWLGIGAAWNGDESRGLGLFFPPTAERFERLEETLQICLQMWSGDEEPFAGTHYHLERTLNSPPALSTPHPPILIGGSGEQKTLRLVAKYAQACNIPAGTETKHKLDVLRAHCEREGRDYDEIQKTAIYRFDVDGGKNCARIVDDLSALAELGIDVAHGSIVDVSTIEPIEILGRDVIPAVASL